MNGDVNVRLNSSEARLNLEKILIASCIGNEDSFITLQSRDIKHNDFKNPICSRIYFIMDTMFKENTMPKETLIRQEFMFYLQSVVKSPEEHNRIIGAYCNMLTNKAEDEEAFEIHFKRFEEFKMKEKLTEILNNAKQMSDSKHGEEVLSYILDSYVTSFNERREVEGIDFYSLMRKDIDSYNPYNPVNQEDLGKQSKTGIYLLDTKYLNGGIAEGNICVIAGRPGSGKTTLVKVIGLNNARDGKKTLFISLEMSKEQIAQGYYSQIARVNYGKVLRRELDAEEFDRLLAANEKEENKLKDYHIVEKDSLTISQLINILIRYHKQYGVEVFLLDYIQQVRLDNGSVPKNEQEYSLISELLRTIIKKLKMKAYICAQVNRECEKRPDKHPVASDLRSSGKLEQDAAYILTTYRDEIYNPLASDHPTDHPGTMDISIAKNRFGPAGMVRVMFEGEYQNITNLTPEEGDISI